jgi:hypothetical protein
MACCFYARNECLGKYKLIHLMGLSSERMPINNEVSPGGSVAKPIREAGLNPMSPTAIAPVEVVFRHDAAQAFERSIRLNMRLVKKSSAEL